MTSIQKKQDWRLEHKKAYREKEGVEIEETKEGKTLLGMCSYLIQHCPSVMLSAGLVIPRMLIEIKDIES